LTDLQGIDQISISQGDIFKLQKGVILKNNSKLEKQAENALQISGHMLGESGTLYDLQ
jgi:hypothetical protein